MYRSMKERGVLKIHTLEGFLLTLNRFQVIALRKTRRHILLLEEASIYSGSYRSIGSPENALDFLQSKRESVCARVLIVIV